MEKVSPKNQMIKSTEVEVCFQCHKDRRAQFERPSHHPLREGDMTCSSCHNPHGSATDSLLRGASINETCYKCHADKRGPFLWEHEPVRESCLNCHEPHGTVNEFLLKVQRRASASSATRAAPVTAIRAIRWSSRRSTGHARTATPKCTAPIRRLAVSPEVTRSTE